jgi:hypothetical protein
MERKMLASHHIETAMNALGYSHGRHEDQAQRVRDFGKVVKGNNFMTPRRLGLYRLKSKPYVIVEITTGEFLGKDLIGVTVADCATGENCFDENACLHSVDELPAIIAKLEVKFA